MKKIFVAGGASYNNVVQMDDFPTQAPATYHHCKYVEGIGSTGAGKSLNLAHLGFDVSFHTLIGNDEYKKKVFDALAHENIHLHFDIDPKGTERHINILNKNGERISIFTNPISDDIQIDIEKLKPIIQSCDLAVINIYAYCKQLLPLCRSLGKPIWTDIHDYCPSAAPASGYYDAFIEYADVIFMSNEKITNPEKTLREFISLGKSIAVCTLGANGAIGLNKNGELYQCAVDTHVRYENSNGAGGAFSAGFMFAHLAGADLRTCMHMATRAAGRCVESSSLANPLLRSSDLTI